MKIQNITLRQNLLIQKKDYSNSKTAPTNYLTDNNKDKIVLKSGYYREMFDINTKISSLSFKGASMEKGVGPLKKVLTNICEEIIDKYNNYERSISENLFTRGFIHESLGFTSKEGDVFHNVKDPFFETEWSSYFYNKNKTTVNGSTLCSVYTAKMEKGIESWTEKFLQTIMKEKEEGRNNLIDVLINSGEDIQQIKNALGLK